MKKTAVLLVLFLFFLTVPIFSSAQCSDGLDNDNDGYIDYGSPQKGFRDRGCISLSDDSENTENLELQAKGMFCNLDEFRTWTSTLRRLSYEEAKKKAEKVCLENAGAVGLTFKADLNDPTITRRDDMKCLAGPQVLWWFEYRAINDIPPITFETGGCWKFQDVFQPPSILCNNNNICESGENTLTCADCRTVVQPPVTQQPTLPQQTQSVVAQINWLQRAINDFVDWILRILPRF